MTAPHLQLQRRASLILERLRQHIPDARCELDFTTPLELAIAAILAAQCTDKRVNQVTPPLFKKYKTARAWAELPQETLEAEIRSTGFFRNKAKGIRNLCAALMEMHNGKLPDDFETLVALPGIGRKTANLVMADGFGKPGMIVDTHQIRVNQRLGFTKQTDATKIEWELRKLIPEPDWTDWSHHITLHGRYTCLARKPACDQCPLADLCPSCGKG